LVPWLVYSIATDRRTNRPIFSLSNDANKQQHIGIRFLWVSEPSLTIVVHSNERKFPVRNSLNSSSWPFNNERKFLTRNCLYNSSCQRLVIRTKEEKNGVLLEKQHYEPSAIRWYIKRNIRTCR
jgi:hypothetical protein